MAFDWEKLPCRLQRGLLAGGTGRSHLAGLARAALSAARTVGTDPEQAGFLARLGFELLLAAWEEDPLNGGLAEPLLTLGQESLTPLLREALVWLAANWKPDARADRLHSRGDHGRLLELHANRSQADAFVVRACVEALLVDGDPGQLPAVLGGLERRGWDGPARLLLDLVRAETRLVRRDFTVVDELERLAAVLPLPGRLARLAHGRHGLGDPEAALRIWQNVRRAQPWNVNMLFRVRDVLLRRDGEEAELQGECSILLYTWNKSEELEQTLMALDATDLSNCRVVVLDNGSSDTTPEVVARWRDKWGSQRMASVRTDVNVGAPAARNWLLARQDVLARPWTVYLDDDAMVPRGWLGRLGAAARVMPEARVWGCKVVDAGRPWVVQNADLHLRPDQGREQSEPGGGRMPTLPVCDIQHQGFDLGQFDALRSCVSVTGCCHLFRTKELVKSGGFDIRYSPSQFDDLDRDLRDAETGGYAVYQGFLRVEHLKRTGAAARRGGSAAGNALGNLVKLRQAHGPRELERLAGHEADRILAEVRRAEKELGEGLPRGLVQEQGEGGCQRF
ncbi:MAG: glycosyltransferase family 2 protein [Desulfovibrio sp.]